MLRKYIPVLRVKISVNYPFCCHKTFTFYCDKGMLDYEE